MSTVFKRVWAFCKNNQKPLLPPKERAILGRIINELYRTDPDWRFIHKIEQKEPEGVFKAWVYPKEFSPKMDAIISNWFADKSVQVPQETVEKKRRKRVLKPQYSASPVKKRLANQ